MIQKSPKPVDTIVGANIRRIRNMRSLSQTVLGEALGITFQQVQKYEKGSNRVSASSIVAVAVALQVNISDLFEGAYGDVNAALSRPSSEAMIIAAKFDRIPKEDARKSIAGIVSMLAA